MAHVRNSRSPNRPSAPITPGNPGRTGHGASAKAGAAKARAHIRGSRPRTDPRTPRQTRATETVEALVTAAARILVEQGYAAASTNAIAQRAGVSIGSLYQYFRDKNDVFAAVVARHRREVMPVIAEILDRMRAPDADLVELTLELLRRMAEVNSKDPRLLSAIDRELGWLEHRHGEADDPLDAVTAILRGRRRKSRHPIEVIAALLVAIVAPLSRWMVHSKPESIESEPLISAFGQMLRGLLGDG
jgi:AcrR family transcriptional regulator